MKVLLVSCPIPIVFPHRLRDLVRDRTIRWTYCRKSSEYVISWSDRVDNGALERAKLGALGGENVLNFDCGRFAALHFRHRGAARRDLQRHRRLDPARAGGHVPSGQSTSPFRFGPHPSGPHALGKQSMNGHVYLNGQRVGQVLWGQSGAFATQAATFDTHGGFVMPDYSFIG